MPRTARLIACSLLALALLSFAVPAYCYGIGVKAYVPTERSASVDHLPFMYNGSFVIYNDGYRDGVYIIRVGVTEPSIISWLNLSEPVFTLRPGQSRLINFSINVTAESARPGEHELIFTPTLLTTGVEPYLDTFANYISSADSWRFRLNVTGPQAASGVQVFFTNESRMNLIQYSALQDTNKVVTQLDRAIKLNVPDKAVVGGQAPITITIFEGLSSRGISLMAVSPEGNVYPINEGNFTFNSIGLWGVIVLVGDEVILGKTVDVTPVQSPLAGIDLGTALAGLSLLALLSVVPLWLMTPAARKNDPYDEVIYKAYVVKKYIDRFDKARLRSAARMLQEEYSGLVAKGEKGKKDEALSAIDELSALANME